MGLPHGAGLDVEFQGQIGERLEIIMAKEKKKKKTPADRRKALKKRLAKAMFENSYRP